MLNSNKQNAFVFVVCGSSEHIETLLFSLKYLKKYTKNEIIVLTDVSRNDLVIHHEHIVDIKTPIHFTHHQASIFLKTGIHNFLPKGKTYCYLDTDIVALSKEVDLIFNEYLAPITFAPDHCKLKSFSPYAVNCGCLEENQAEILELTKVLKTYDLNQSLGENEIQSQKELIKLFNQKKQNKLPYLLVILRFALSRSIFKFENYIFNKQEKTWYDSRTQKAVLFDFSRISKKVSAVSPFSWSGRKRMWVNVKNENVYTLECNHLGDNIKNTFKIQVKKSNWQHWNGGVFLFNEKSSQFLDAWHKKSMEVIDLKEWKTRDQGTLIATAWEFGLENHKVLDKKWNFIADYNKDGLDFSQEGLFTDDYWKTKYEVSFVHIYHHWGDETWDLWRWVQDIEL